MTDSLRMRVVEAAKSAIGASFVEQMGWGESKPMAALEAYAVAQGQAEAALDAMLDVLAENADEWWLQAFQPERRDGKVTDGLIATLREDRWGGGCPRELGGAIHCGGPSDRPAWRGEVMSEHEHVWRFKYTNENWFDGDETDVYECEVEGCNELDHRYISR